jgi:hypothetical protein
MRCSYEVLTATAAAKTLRRLLKGSAAEAAAPALLAARDAYVKARARPPPGI